MQFTSQRKEDAKEDTEDNTIYQMAFERVLSLFNEDPEEDINNAFELLFAQEKTLLPGVKGPVGTCPLIGCNAVR